MSGSPGHNPPLIPSITIPGPPTFPEVPMGIPKALVPYYRPLVVPPSDLEAPPEVQAEETEETQPEVRKLEIPVIDIEVPVPAPEILVTALSTAVVAVATTTIAQTFFEPIQKNVKKQLQKQVDAWRKKRKNKTSSTESKENEESLKKNK